MSQPETGLGFEIHLFGNNYLKETFVKSKPSFKFSSHLLISTLIASSFLMVNCNKGGTRTGVKAKTVAGKVDPSQKGTATNTKQCSADILKAYSPLSKEYVRVKKLHDTKVTEKTNEKLKSEYEKVLAACDVFGVAFDKEKIEGCDLPDKDKTNLPKAPNQCLIIADLLFKEDGTKTPYLKLANDQKVIAQKQQEEKLIADFKKEKLLISEEMKAMLKFENLDFKMYIVDGEIKTNQDDLKKAYQDKKVVCSFSGTSTPVEEKEKVFLSLNDVFENKKSEVPEGMSLTAGLSMSAKAEKKDESVVDLLKMVCSHLSVEKFDVKLLKKAFGKHLAVEVKESLPAQAEPVVGAIASGDGTKAVLLVKPAAKKVSADDSKADKKDDKKIELKKSKASTAQSGDGSIEASTLSLAP
jgi:hypothetical protein